MSSTIEQLLLLQNRIAGKDQWTIWQFGEETPVELGWNEPKAKCVEQLNSWGYTHILNTEEGEVWAKYRIS